VLKNLRAVLVVGFVAGVAARAAAADDFASQARDNWHQWRGPQATGVAPNADPPIEWSESKNVKWKVKIAGETTATPIVWGDRVFLTSAVMTDRTIELPEGEADPKGPYAISRPRNYYQFTVMCVDRQTGKTLWQQVAREAVPHEGHHPDGSFASASPTTDGKQLYVSFGSRGIYCYDLEGQQKWSRDFGPMKIIFTFGEGTSPVLFRDTVIVNWDHQGGLEGDKTDGSFITALDAKTGETRWRTDRDETTTWATPLLIEYGGRTQAVVQGGKRVRSYDAATGELIWACGGQMPTPIPTPVSDGQNVYCMSGYLGSAVFAIPLSSVGDITDAAKLDLPEKIAWRRKEPGAPYVPSPMLYGELLYYTQSNRGILTCLNAKTGEPVIDRKRLQGVQNLYASPVGAADRVYFTDRGGTTLVIKKGPELEVLATNKLDDQFDGSMALVGKEIFLRGKEHLYCIAAE
jgi:outer membrane protein assembly factor BamB